MNFTFPQETKHLNVEIFLNEKSYTSQDTIFPIFKISIKNGYHINSYKPIDTSFIPTTISINSEDFKIHTLHFPNDKIFDFQGISINVYEGVIYIGTKITPNKKIKNGTYPVKFTLNYQACSDKICDLPEKVDILTEIIIDSTSGKDDIVNKEIFSKIDFSNPSVAFKSDSEVGIHQTEKLKTETSEDEISKKIESEGILLTLIFIFIGGLGLNLTPCIYPLIPITISYFGSQTGKSKSESIINGTFYAIGMAITYTALGLFAALTGGLFAEFMQKPVVLVGIAIIFILLSLSMFGLYEIRVPQKLALTGSKTRKGFLGSFVMGLFVGVIAAPCIGPIILSLLIHVGQVGKPLYGLLLFGTLSLGLGAPYIVLAAFSNALSKLPRSGEWMIGVKVIFGLILIGVAFYYLIPVLPKDIGNFIFYAYFIVAGVYLVLIDKKGENSKVFTKIKYIFAILAIIIGTYNLKASIDEYNLKHNISTTQGNTVQWILTDNIQSIDNVIKNADKPIMIDFYADWCLECKQLDKETYRNPEIIELSKSFINIKVDLTKTNQAIQDRFNIKGLPVVAFLDRNGNEIKSLRVTGFEPPEDLKVKMEKVLKNDNK
ncbi:MAG: thioredoxin family protein [Ignavibacteria bacterium]|nr:thioredoxin family protein [Ignavibacteria bacterium]